MRTRTVFIKTIAAVLALTFSTTQLTYAADVRQMLIDAKNSFAQPDEERRPGVTSQALQQATSTTQAAVDQQNALADLQAMNFSLTSANGDVLKYVGDTLKTVERPDGTTLNNIKLGADGKITDANLELSDGSVQILSGGQVIGYMRPDGTAVQYDAATGKVSRTTSASGVVSLYTYGTSTTTVDISDGTKAVYALDGTLQKITKPDGTIAEFVSGRLSKVTKGTVITNYSSQTLADGSFKLTAPVSTNAIETILPTTLYNTSAVSYKSWDNQIGWYSWGKPYGDDYWVTYWGYQWLDYTPTMTQAGDLKVSYQALNDGKVPVNYPGFQIEYFVDGVSQGIGTVTANASNWQNAGYTLKGLSAGSHTIRIKFTNDANDSVGGDANFKFRNLSFTQVVAGTGVPDGFPKEILYSKDNVITQATMADGSKLVFDKGLLKEAYDAAGVKTAFSFDQSSFGNVFGSTISQGGVDSKYDSAGKLSSIKVNDLTIHYGSTSSPSGQASIKFIEKADGTELWDLVVDAKGVVTDAAVYTPDGTERIYKAGALVSMRRPDNTALTFNAGKAVQMITPDKLTYDFTYTQAAIEAKLATGSVATDALAPVKMVYDTSFNLKEITRQNQQIIQYLNNDVNKILAPDQAEQVFKYVKDAAGNVLSYSVVQANVETFYDANNQPIKAVISPTADNPNTLQVNYQYGKIRDITKNGVKTFVYTYLFDTAGRELLKVEDLEEHTVKNYIDSLLMNESDADTSVISTYTYKGPDVSKVELTRFGRVLHTYTYAYANGLTMVTDEEGALRTYDAKKKLLALERDGTKMAYSYSMQSGKEIVQEALVEKKLADGSVVSYDKGQISLITLADGTKITDVVLDANRALVKATATLKDGSKKIFDASKLVEDIWADGSHLYYRNGKLTRSTDAKLGDLTFTDTSITKGSVKLQYSADGALTGIKLADVDDPAAAMAKLTNTYEGGANGPYSFDGNTNTAETAGSSCSGCGGTGAWIYSTHALASEQTVSSVEFKMSAAGFAHGSYIRDWNAHYEVNVLKGGTWQLVSGSWGGGSGGDGSGSYDSGVVTLNNLNLSGVTGVRAYATGFGNSSGGSGASNGGSAAIYEIKFTLADQSVLNYAKTSSGYSLTGLLGAVSFDASGNAVTGYPAVYKTAATALGSGAIASFASMPYFSSLNAPVPAALTTWSANTQSAILSASDIVSQEYSSATGIMETQVKADKTVTLFANNKPSKVLDEKGTVLITYTYDAAGNISRVYLKNARDTLPNDVLAAQEAVEEQRAATLLELAKQKNLAYSTIKANADTQRAVLITQRNALQSQYDGLASTEVKGGAARSAKADSLGQIQGGMDQITVALTTLAKQEADAYAALDAQVKTASDKIAADAQNAYTEIRKQETALKKEILRQEVSPVVYDYYRRILGRDPSSAEYDAWIARVDYDSPVDAPAKVITTEKAAAPTETVLATTLYDTTALSTKAWDGQVAWYSWEKPWGKDYMVTYWADQWVEYKPTLTKAGDLKISLETINDGAVPANYPGFSLDILIDGVKWGNYNAAAVDGVWNKNTFTLSNVSAGTHTIRIKWMNFLSDSVGKAAFKYRAISFTQVVSAAASVVSKPLTDCLTAELNALPELAERTAYVNAVKKKVSDAVNGYLAKSDADKKVFAASLGIGEGESIPLSGADAQKILTWLNSRSLHFGQSAFLSLESLLDQKGITYTREDLAYKAIMTDILSGIITPMDDGDLVLSVFALNKVAKSYGLELTAANLTYDDLVKAASKRLVAHVNGNHFVIITSVTADNVTYIDTGIGKDKQNQSVTVSKKDFLKMWKGTVTGEKATLDPVIASSTGAKVSRVLSLEETKRIRGAFLGLIFFAIAAITSAIGGAVATIGAALAGFLATVGPMLQGALVSLANGIGTALSGLGNGIYTMVKFAASTLYNAGSQLFASLSGQSVFASVNQTAFGGNIFQNVVQMGVKYALTKGLSLAGLDERVASIASAFATGNALSAFNNAGVSIGKMMADGMKAAAVAIGQTALQAANISSSLGSVITNFAKPLADGLFSGNISGVLVKLAPDLGKELAIFGAQTLANSLGVDPRLSSTLASGMVNGISSFFTNIATTGVNILKSLNTSIAATVVKYGLEFVGNSSPILGSLLSPDIINGIEQSINRQGLIGTALNILGNSALRAVNVIGGVVQNVTSGITQFATVISQKGLGGALEYYSNALFGQSALESALSKGGFSNLVATGARTNVTLANGTAAQEIKIDGLNSIYVDSTNKFLGVKENGTEKIGVFGVDTLNRVGLTEGHVNAALSTDSVLNAEIKDSQFESIWIDGPSNSPLLEISPEKNNSSILMEKSTSSGALNVVDATVNVVPLALSIAMKRALVYQALLYDIETAVSSNNVSSKTLFALVNGIQNNETDPAISPDYINNYESDIAGTSLGQYVAERDFMKSAIYQHFTLSPVTALDNVQNQAKDITSLFFEAMSPITHLASTLKILADFDNRFRLVPGDRTRPIVAMGYSGGFLPMIEAIMSHHYKTDTLIGLGAATTSLLNIKFEDISKILNNIFYGQMSEAINTLSKYLVGIQDMTTLGIKRAINVWGTKDILYQLGIAGKRDNIGGVKTYNIEIDGATHFDYMRRSGETDPKKADFNAAVSKFVTDLTLAGNDDAKLLVFLQRTMTAPDSDGVWRFRP